VDNKVYKLDERNTELDLFKLMRDVHLNQSILQREMIEKRINRIYRTGLTYNEY